MNSALMTSFNDLTENRFDYLVLESVEADVRSQTVRINLLYPEPKEEEVREAAEEIRTKMIEAFGLRAAVAVKLTKSHFDEEFFRFKTIEFFKDFPSVAPYVFAEDIIIKRNGEYDYDVEIPLDEDICAYATAHGVPEAFRKMLASSYCEHIGFELVPVKVEDRVDHIAEAEEELRNYVYETRGGRYIVPENVEELVGSIVYDRAGYIADAKREAESVTYCGTVSEFTECNRKMREGETSPRKFYKFTLTDPTGSMKCLFFPRNTKHPSKITLLQNGRQVVVKGNLKENRFQGRTTFDMFVNSLSLCTLPEHIEIEMPVFHPRTTYKCVSPGRYTEATQTNVFDLDRPTPKYLLGKTFCVFDLETTGTDEHTCKIIEIGAVKIENGVLTETFSTYVDPHEPIPLKITELTSITDSMVRGAPSIEDVLPDFYLFAGDSVLVGQYVSFDLGFINAAGRPMGIRFDNPCEDTIEIAHEQAKGLANYKLGTILKHYGINNEHAHRAIHDAVATAKLFIAMAEKR